MILDELNGRDADILTLQEVDIENYNEFFAPNLAQEYKGVFQAKGRARTMSEKEAKIVDGCATFYKHSKYLLLQKHIINYSHEAINRPDMKGEHDVYNRVMPRDHIALVLFLENRQTGSRLVVVNTHLTWEVWFSDVKIIQVAILMEQLGKKAEEYAKWPPTKDKDKEVYRYANEDSVEGVDGAVKPEPVPSLSYESGTQIPILVCGDFNSTHDSGVYDLITQGSLSSGHSELGSQKYGDFTRNGMTHPFNLQSSYSKIGELPFTNWTPDFRQVIDYIWYSTNTLQVAGLLGQVDPTYMSRVPGFPNYQFPSDHLLLMAEYSVKERKERKQVEADFGPGRRESRQ
jgi:CCR4-NOT transcription complex subunit 6